MIVLKKRVFWEMYSFARIFLWGQAANGRMDLCKPRAGQSSPRNSAPVEKGEDQLKASATFVFYVQKDHYNFQWREMSWI